MHLPNEMKNISNSFKNRIHPSSSSGSAARCTPSPSGGDDDLQRGGGPPLTEAYLAGKTGDVRRSATCSKNKQCRINPSSKAPSTVQEVEVDPSLEGLQMKSRKVKQTSRFFPQTIDRVKRQIEELINGQEQYLEGTDARTYRYVTGTADD